MLGQTLELYHQSLTPIEDSCGGFPVRVVVFWWMGESIPLIELATEMGKEEKEGEEEEEDERRTA